MQANAAKKGMQWLRPYLFENTKYPFKLPELPYKYEALEPYLDSATMKIHHSKHHQTYVNNLNLSLEKHTELHNKPIEELLITSKELPDPLRSQVQNFGGGHKNHYLYWEIIGPEGSREPTGTVKSEITKHFGSYDKFKEYFSTEATKLFGSGWTWLSVDNANKLVISSTINQASPLQQGLKPIFTIDVWEHAYYLKYQNRRPDFIKDFWNVVNWDKVETFYHKALN